jgi:hypothetical protein
VLAIGTVGCSPKGPPSDEVEGASPAALNASPQITNFAVYAQNSATLRDRAALSGGDLGVRVAGTGPFLVTGYELALVSGAQVDTTHNTIANRVLLQGAKIGDVQTNTLTVQNGGTYTKKYAFPTTMPALPALAPVFAGTTALTVNASSTVVVSPGKYGAVSIGTKGVLRLQGGVYHWTSLQLDDDARIEALAPVQVRVAGRVAGRLSTLARVWIGAATGVTLTAADLRIEVSGKNGTGGGLTETPKAAAFGNDATILGVILIPNGTLQIGQRNTVTGALVGRDVYVDMDSKVIFQSGMAVLKCAQSCNDGNPCTKDTCTNEVCSYPAAASGTSCSDGNPCNGAETCDGKGACKAGIPVTCSALDQCHVAGVCDSGTGVCSNPTKADGTSCNDANACTVSDSCKAGTCSGTTYSCDDGLACTTDACKGDGTCTHTLAANNCLIGGACYASGGLNPTNSCQQCTPATSTSNWTSKSNGTACNDGNACTKGDVCTGGSCAGTAYSCNDNVACTNDVCNGDGTCSHTVTAGNCAINGACYASGAANPANLCQQCTPGSSQTAWSLRSKGTICRAAGGGCDLAEVCDGTSPACPADGFVPKSTVCRASAGLCDVAEACTGASAACPADAFAPSTTVCRASAGICDVAETCTGSNAACPPDGFLQASLACRPAVASCDAVEVCSGTSATCPPDAFLPASTVCRASTGTCDPAESCTGSGPTCPPDVNTLPPAAPTQLAATALTAQARLTWAVSAGATSYNLKRSETSGGPYTPVATTTSPLFVDSGLTNGTRYYYVVTAVGGCGESGNSNEAAITPNAGYCSTSTASFCDDFEDGDDTNPPWTPRQGAQAADFQVVSDGTNQVLKQGQSGSGSQWRVAAAGSLWADLTVQAKVKVLSFNGSGSDRYVGLFVRYDTSTDAAGYYLALQPNNQFQLRKIQGTGPGSCINATWPNTACQQQQTIATGQWYTLKLVVKGNTLTAYIDGTKVEEATDAEFPSAGAIAVGSFNGATFEVDDITVDGSSVTDCAAAIIPDPSLSGRAQEIKYQEDILRLCTGRGIGPCERALRARANVDFFAAAAQLVAETLPPAMYLAVVHDRDRKLDSILHNETAACKIVQDDPDGDFVPGDVDQCSDTPDLTPTTANGCPDSNLPSAPPIGDIKKSMGKLGIVADPRCLNAPWPVEPTVLGAWRYPIQPSNGKAIWISKDPDTSGCPIYYEVDVILTDGAGIRHLAFHATEDTTLSWIVRPAGAVQFNLHTGDGGDRGAWASYAVWTKTLRARAVNLAGRRSDWSNWFSVARRDCIAGACND